MKLFLVLFLAVLFMEMIVGPYDFHSRSIHEFLKIIGFSGAIALAYVLINKALNRVFNQSL